MDGSGPRDGSVAPDPRSTRLLRVADLLLYSVVVTAVVVVVTAPVSLLAGGTLVGVKFALFALGFVVLAAGSWKLRPPANWRETTSRIHVADTRGGGNFQGLVDSLPPLRGHRLRDADRYSDGAKLLLAGLLMLATSFLMEAVLGIPR